MSYYDDLVAQDIITLARPLLAQAGYKLRFGDGKLIGELSMAWDTPWIHVRHSDLDCYTWHQVMFDVIFARIGKKFVPAKCQNCYKVVVRPQSIVQLFALLGLQQQLNLPSKCGIETRPSVHGLYGGYFYNWGIEAGKECWQTVRDAVTEDPVLGEDVAVILKRACTEYEMACGPSDQWEVTPEQEEIEALVNRLLVRDPMTQQQPEHLWAHVQRKWIEWAYANGDPTYAAFTDGKPLYPPYVTYHEAEPPPETQ
jgi:hypothetical protein